MAIFGLFLKSIFLVALLVAVFIIGVIVYLYLRVKRVAKSFAYGGRSAANGGQRTSANGGQRTSANGGSQGNYTESSADDSSFVNEELYDERSPREANRKIFPKNEGEYVDFEEE